MANEYCVQADRTHISENQKEWSISSSIPRNGLRKLVLPVPTTLGSVGVEILSPRGDKFAPGDSRVPLNMELQPLARHSVLLALGQAAKRGVPVTSGALELENQEEVGSPAHDGDRENIFHTWTSLGTPLPNLIVNV